ncbi:UNVERIFIED_CONTAM: hypothetical protein Sradi_3650700 [Sesamum radiatum]|uniref:RNase H type-1 domain-containing protein n=1 Tax=Sesamum radiatum TaxID=300843 RepID=A0AAW2QIV5_SESRA
MMSIGNLGEAGAGGILRDGQRIMIFAFYEFLGTQTNAYVELFAIVHGVQLARHLGYQQIWVEIDTQAVLHLISKEEGDWQLQVLLTKLRMLKRQMHLKFTHVYREGN